MLLFSFILSLISLQTAIGVEFTIKPDSGNVLIENLDHAYLVDRFTENLTFLKITNSKIERIDEFAFDFLKHLNLLDLSDNEIYEEIHPDTFSRLQGLEFLVLRNISLRRVDLKLNNVQELILAGNEIEQIGGERIFGKNVNYLDVSSNKLEHLRDSFRLLGMLSMVDLSRNRISSIGGDVFGDNANLVRVLAGQNRLASTEGLRLPWLKSLDLYSNKLAALGPDAFPRMEALEELVLAFNQIKDLQDPFKDLFELKNLNLGWNRIEELRPDLFRNCLYLTKLSLQGNKLRSLDRFANVLTHLTHLDLSHNDLELLDDDFFSSTPNLVVLNLGFNGLKSLADVLAPLKALKTLDLAYNRIALGSFEFSSNPELTRLNLSSNMVEGGVSHFRQNPLLTSLDLSQNQILYFCDSDLVLPHLAKLSLKGNSISNLTCLNSGKFNSLCEADLRNNPLECGDELDNLIYNLAVRKNSPYNSNTGFHSDLHQSQCETLSLDRSIELWNSVKRDLCPGGDDLPKEITTEWNSQEEVEDSDKWTSLEKLKNLTGTKFVVLPLRWNEDSVEDLVPNPQSERNSWEDIDKNPDLLGILDDEDEPTYHVRQYDWYINPIIIALAFIVAAFNLVVCLYIRIKIWRKVSTPSTQKYIFLHNEVYKNTTEPTPEVPVVPETGMATHTRNKVLSYGKVNEILSNFGKNKKEKDAESDKNVLIDSSNSQNV